MIGGNVSMAKKKYNRPSGLKILRTQIEDYVRECLTEDHGLGLTDMTAVVIENLAEEIFFDTCKIIDKKSDITSAQKLGDSRNPNISPPTFYYKKNNYNLNLLGSDIKVKIWIGLPARISRENLILAKEKYPDYHQKYFIDATERDLYRIECYELVRGFTFEDMLRKDKSKRGVWYGIPLSEIPETREEFAHKFQHKNKHGCIVESIITAFARFITNEVHCTRYGRSIYYPNDCNPGNLVWNYDGTNGFPHDVVNIDYDHMIITNPKQMIHNVAWQFFSRIFDKEELPDDVVTKDVANWRKTHDLFVEVEKFKLHYYDITMIEYDSDRECFDYKVTKSTLNNSEVLYQYVQDKIKEYKPEEEQRRVHNDDGKEIIDESTEDDDME